MKVQILSIERSKQAKYCVKSRLQSGRIVDVFDEGFNGNLFPYIGQHVQMLLYGIRSPRLDNILVENSPFYTESEFYKLITLKKLDKAAKLCATLSRLGHMPKAI